MLSAAPVYIERVPNRSSPPAILLRESFRQDGKVRKRTVLNLTKWPPKLIEGLRVLLKGGTAVSDFEDSFAIVRSEGYGHIAATLGSLRKLGLDAILDSRPSRSRDIACALIVDRVLQPLSTAATVSAFDPEPLPSSLRAALGLGSVSADDLCRTMDWLLERQSAIEARLVKRYVESGRLALAYVSEFDSPPVGAGSACDSRTSRLPVPFGLLCNAVGCPVAVRVFDGDRAESSTAGQQLDALRQHFGSERVALVGDCGVGNELQSLGCDWITSLRRPAIRKLAAKGLVQPSLFDQRDLVEFTNPDYVGQRLLAWRDLDAMRKRARRREESLRDVEEQLELIAGAVRSEQDPLRGAGQIGLRVGMAIRRRKVAKHFELRIGDCEFSYARQSATIAAEAALDGLYAIRTNLAAEDLPALEVVRAHQRLGQVERAFRSDQASDRTVDPPGDSNAEWLRAHVLLCMLAYHVEWHMRAKLAPLLSGDQGPSASEAQRSSDTSNGNAKERPRNSFRSLLENLSTITCNRIEPQVEGMRPFEMLTRPSELQRRVFELLGVELESVQ